MQNSSTESDYHFELFTSSSTKNMNEIQAGNELDTPPIRPKHIRQLDKVERHEFLQSFDTVFCDCDGVLWQTLRDVIPGSSEAIEYLRQLGKQIVYVTNNSIVTTEEHLQKFALCNIPVERHELLHPAQTVCDYLHSIGFEGLVLCMASAAFKNTVRQAGFQLAAESQALLSESVEELRAAIYVEEPVKAIIIDVDFNMTATKLMRAHVHLKKSPDCLLIGGAADMLVPIGSSDVLGSGPFINIVEQSAKRSATILGKPGRALGEILKKRCVPERALFIGDSLTSDIKFGKMCGFQTLLVLSGGQKTCGGWIDESERPDYVADFLADIIE